MVSWTFNGEWSSLIQLQAFDFGGEGTTFPLHIEDLLNDDPDPLSAQVAAIDYLITHQKRVAANLIGYVYDQYEGLKKVYAESMPVIHHKLEIKDHITLTGIFISTRFKEGHSYVDFTFRCPWDEEHGLGISSHRENIFHLGGIGDVKRMGEDDASVKINTIPPGKPRLYSPHPKFGKLKPSQLSANRYYEIDLIRGFFNKDFIEFMERTGRDVNYVNQEWGFWGTYIGWAIQANNHDLTTYLLSRGAKLNGIIHHINHDKEKIDWLIANGVSIDERDGAGHTLLRGLLFGLRGDLTNRETAKKYNHGYLDSSIQAAEGKKELIRWMISRGANPKNADLDSVMCFSGRDYDSAKLQKEIIECLVRL